MNRSEFARAVAEEASLTIRQAEQAERAFESIISGVLRQGGRLKLSGFGTFETADRPERMGRNPKTGKEVRVPARRTVRFRPGKELKENIR